MYTKQSFEIKKLQNFEKVPGFIKGYTKHQLIFILYVQHLYILLIKSEE